MSDDLPRDDLARQLARSVEAFAARVLDPRRAALEGWPPGEWPREVLTGLQELGLLDVGALEDPALERAALEALGRHSAAVALIVFAHSFGARLAPSPREGLFGSACYADLLDDEPALRATRSDRGVTLDGRAELVVNAPIARWLALPVWLDGAIALVTVATDAPGLSLSDPLVTLGARGCPTADVLADGVVASDLTEDAVPVLERACRLARGPALAIGAGVLAASLSTAEGYAKERYQGGSAIIEHAQIRAMLADMAVKTTVCREASVRLCADDLPEETSASLFSSAKDGLAPAASSGVQILGGNGYMTDYPQEGRLRDARQLRCLLGRPDPLLQRIWRERAH